MYTFLVHNAVNIRTRFENCVDSGLIYCYHSSCDVYRVYTACTQSVHKN